MSKRNKRNRGKNRQVVPTVQAQGSEYVVAPQNGNPPVIGLAYHKSYSFQGPTPPPDVLQAYHTIYPDSVRIIFESFEKQGDHRRRMESQYMNHAINRSWGGLISALIVVLALIGLGGYAVSQGQGLAGAAAFASAMGGLVIAFLIGQSQQSKERESKAKIMTGK